MDDARPGLITVTYDRSSLEDGRYVGVICVGTAQAYRTVRTHGSPETAQAYAEHILRYTLGEQLAGQEWAMIRSSVDHVPRTTDFIASAEERLGAAPQGNGRSYPR